MNYVRRPQAKPRVVAKPALWPAPTGGWNAASALDQMPANEAETLINFFPQTTWASLRRGYALFCDIGTSGEVRSLIEYDADTSKLLAAVDGDIYEISTGTASSLGTGFAVDTWEATNFSTNGGAYVLMVNGSDTPQIYDGTTLTAAANTEGGVPTTRTFHQVEAYNQRIFYAEVDTLSVWYLPVGDYQGALTQFDFGPLCTRGGVIASITTWTRDNGFGGANEMFTVVTNKGEVLIYNGPDPATWSQAARFLVGEPVSGLLPVTRLGPDCVLMCEDGFQPMATYLQLGESKAQAIAMSAKIGNAVTQAVNLHKNEDGWQALLYPQGNMLIFNVPQGSGVFYQYVVNTITGAWTLFTGMNAWCWALFDDKPYFGGAGGKVYKADTGTSDNGAAIEAEWRGSYQYIGSPGQIKRFTMMRPIFQTTGPLIIGAQVDVDFLDTNLTSPSVSIFTTSLWGTAVWGSFLWGGSYQLQQQWLSVNGLGYAVAPHIKVSTATISMNLMSTNILYENGAFI